jgi:hypothetical protein
MKKWCRARHDSATLPAAEVCNKIKAPLADLSLWLVEGARGRHTHWTIPDTVRTWCCALTREACNPQVLAPASLPNEWGKNVLIVLAIQPWFVSIILPFLVALW